jgi:hypothetical protein
MTCGLRLVTTHRWAEAKPIRDAAGIEALPRLRYLIDYLEANTATLVKALCERAAMMYSLIGTALCRSRHKSVSCCGCGFNGAICPAKVGIAPSERAFEGAVQMAARTSRNG